MEPKKHPKSDLSTQYDLISEQYIEGQREYYGHVADEATQFIIESIPNINGQVLLDLGCGAGNDLLFYQSQGAKEVWGIDASEKMVCEARKKCAACSENILVGTFESLPFKDKTFDVVVSRYALHYLQDFEKTYQEIARVLKDDGKFIFIAHHPIRDLVRQKEKKYGQQEIIVTELFNNKVPIQFPTHTLTDYLSTGFFKHFCLTGLTEGETADDIVTDGYVLPGFIGISATKK